MLGGLVFVPLSEALLADDFGANYHKEGPIGLVWQWSEGVRESEDHATSLANRLISPQSP